jgi:hypothetical protein
MEIWWKCCLNGGGYINVQYYNPGGWTRRDVPKNYSHNFFNRIKKVVTGQSQIACFSCFKSILANPRFGHLLDMLRTCCVNGNIFINVQKWGYVRNGWMAEGWMNQDLNQKYSNFKRNIFGRKVCFTCFPIIQTGTFIIKIQDFEFRISKFWTEYFRPKSGFSHVFLLSRQGLL